MTSRRGLGKGSGKKGYYNMIPKDPKVHSDSAMGRKQPQRVSRMTELTERQCFEGLGRLGVLSEEGMAKLKELRKKDSDGDGVPDHKDCQPLNPKKQDSIKIIDIMSMQDKKYAEIAKIIGFKKRTIHFTDLGYPDYVAMEVLLEGYSNPISVEIKPVRPTKELNKLFKGRTINQINKGKLDCYVTKGDWNVNYTFGGDIPTGKVRFEPFYYRNDKLVKGEGFGEIMTKEEAQALAIKKGYLQPYTNPKKL